MKSQVPTSILWVTFFIPHLAEASKLPDKIEVDNNCLDIAVSTVAMGVRIFSNNKLKALRKGTKMLSGSPVSQRIWFEL
jgi:hypothetical protein